MIKALCYVSVGIVPFLPLGFIIYDLRYRPAPVARDGFDCEILSVSRKIKAGNSPDFDALRASNQRNGETMILRAMDNFNPLGAEQPVLDAYRVVLEKMNGH